MLLPCHLRQVSRFSLALAAALTLSVAARPVVAFGQAEDSEGWDTKVAVLEYNAGHFDAAIALFSKAINKHRGFADSYFNRGLCYEGKNEWISALSDFDFVVAKRPKMYDAYVERCRCYLALGDLDKAQANLNAAIDLKPDRPDAYELQGDLRVARKDFDNAVKSYTHYIDASNADAKAHGSLNRPDPHLYEKRGMANLSAKNYEAAAEDFDQYIQLDPRDAASSETYLLLGDAYTGLKQYPAAIKAYTAYIDAHPNDTVNTALLNRGMAKYQATQYTEAAVDFSAYIKLHPDKAPLGIRPTEPLSIPVLEATLAKDPQNTSVRIQYARALNYAKRFSDSILQYDIILAASPDDHADRFNRGLSESMIGDDAKAAADIEVYTKAKPSESVGWKVLAIIYGKQSKWKEAEAADSKAIALNPNDIDLYKDRGIAEYNLRDYKAAVADLEKYNAAKPKDEQAVKLLANSRNYLHGDSLGLNLYRPVNADDWFTLGVAYAERKQYTPAVVAFTKALALKPDERCLMARGRAYYHLAAADPKAFKKALADADAALAFKPDDAEARILKADAEFATKAYVAAASDYATYLTLPGISAEERAYAQQQATLASKSQKGE